MLQNSVRLFTIRGIEVGVHYSWLIIFALLTWSLSVYVFPRTVRNLPQVEYWILGPNDKDVVVFAVLHRPDAYPPTRH